MSTTFDDDEVCFGGSTGADDLMLGMSDLTPASPATENAAASTSNSAAALDMDNLEETDTITLVGSLQSEIEVAKSLAEEALKEKEKEKEDLLNASIDLLEEEKLKTMEKEEEKKQLNLMIKELTASLEQKEQHVCKLSTEKVELEKKYTQLLTVSQQNQKTSSLHSELEEALSLAQSRMEIYAQENHVLKQKLNEYESPTSAFYKEKEDMNLRLVSLQEELQQALLDKEAQIEDLRAKASENEAEDEAGL